MSDFKAKMHKIHNSKFDFRWGCPDTAGGLTEIAGLDIDGRVKKRGWTLQDWTLTDDFAGVDIVGLDNGGPDIDGRIPLPSKVKQ